jgi:GNAT superfamily N-acetyltransferase
MVGRTWHSWKTRPGTCTRSIWPRDAEPDDIRGMAAVYSACITEDPGYLPFLAAGDEAAILAWFRLKPLVACLVADRGSQVAGVAGLRDAAPGPGAGEPGGQWLEACRLAVHPAHRGGAVTRPLIGARVSRAAALGADRLWMRCVEAPLHTGAHCRAGGRGGRGLSSTVLPLARALSCWPAGSQAFRRGPGR